jgi:monoamine oxidase
MLEPGNRWNGLIQAINTYVSGAELDQVSLHDLANYADSHVNWRVAEGYGTAIAAHAAMVPMALNCPARVIDHGGPHVTLETAKGKLTADQVVVTLPTSLLADGMLTFAPALPAKIEAAAGLPLGLAAKLFLSLDQAEEFPKDSRLFGHHDRAATGAYHMRPFGRPQIEVYFGGAHAWHLEGGGAPAFFDAAVSELVSILGAGFAKRVKPLAIHLWGHDPFARGAYSSALPGKAGCRTTLAAPVDGRLFFAGEACSPHDYSTAHGAYLSGIAAADAVLTARGTLR